MSHANHDHGGMPDISPGSMSDGNMTSQDMGMAMQMSFFWGKDVIILFAGWPEHSLKMYILALVFVFVLSAGVEILSISPTIKLGTSPVVAGAAHACVYALRMALAYLVMLAVMSFNLGIFIVAVAGHAVGYFYTKCRQLAIAAREESIKV